MLVLLLLFVTVSSVHSSEFPLDVELNILARDDVDYRLPSHVYPVHYDLTLEPNFDTFNFTGQEVIEVQVTEAANNITFHAYTITIESIEVTAENGIAVNSSFVLDETRHFVIVEFESDISAGTYYLYINFIGILNLNNRGFYRGKYEDENGEEVWFATTKFEPVYARQAFPCFDEPALKAQFTISVIHYNNYSAISNMNINYTEPVSDGIVKDVFERSITMSTYLVAFIVSDFGSISNNSHSVYATKQLIEEGRGAFALDMSQELLQALEDYTNVSYPLDKMYQVGLPDDWFPSGAMENWGIVTYKERYLLFKENYTSTSEKQTITTIISHEYAHQWFGNLVTPTWWKYIWLNEGFATYFENYAASLVQPTWRLMEQFVIKSHQYAFESDSLATTRPMSSDASSPSQITGLFDTVIYDKAGSVIRMMEHFLTTPVYQQGLTIYLSNRSYAAAEPTDLWSGLQEALENQNEIINLPLGASVESIMDTWTTQSGYPVLDVVRDYTTGSVTFSQSRFLLYNATPNSEEIFHIPINYATADNLDFSDTSASLWLTNASATYEISSLNPSSWLIVNKQQSGYYRVNYDDTNWGLIAEYLASENFEKIHVINRAQIVDDAFNLARSGRLNYSVLLDVLEYVAQETDYVPLYSFSRGLTYLDRLFAGHDYYEEFQAYIVKDLQKAYDTVGTDLVADEPVDVRYNRINIIKWMCLYGGGNCQEVMTTKLSEGSYVHPDLQASVYCGGMRNGSIENWKYLFEQYVNGSLEYNAKSRVLAALGCSLNRDILERFLSIPLGLDSEFTLSTSLASSVFSSVYGGSYFGVEVAFEYFIDKFSDINDKLSTGTISSILSGITTRLTTTEDLAKLESFISTLDDELQSAHASAFSTAQSNINSNLLWWSQSEDSIVTWFKEHDNSTSTTESIPTESSTESSSTESSSTESSSTASTTESSTQSTSEGTTQSSSSTTESGEDNGAGSLVLSSLLLPFCIFIFVYNVRL